MPITFPRKTCRVSQDEFKAIASEVMHCVFDIHNEFGRMFNESIYKRELQMRIPNVFLEVPILVTYGTFSKVYKVDVMVGDSGLFEFKTVEKLHTRHRGQLLNYLLLLDLAHGKLINLRTQRVEHEFVNCHSRLSDLRQPRVDDREWRTAIAGAERLRTLFELLVADWDRSIKGCCRVRTSISQTTPTYRPCRNSLDQLYSSRIEIHNLVVDWTG